MRLQEESGMMDSRTRGNSELGSYFVNQHRGQWVALGSALLLLVGAIDFATGMKLRLALTSIGTDSEGTEAVGFGFEPIDAGASS